MSLKQQEPQLQLLEQYTTFHLSHGYDRKSKVWKFIGYTCKLCNRTVQNPNIVPKHYSNCTANKPSIYLQDPDPNQIRDVRGDVWKPFDVTVRKITKHG